MRLHGAREFQTDHRGVNNRLHGERANEMGRQFHKLCSPSGHSEPLLASHCLSPWMPAFCLPYSYWWPRVYSYSHWSPGNLNTNGLYVGRRKLWSDLPRDGKAEALDTSMIRLNLWPLCNSVILCRWKNMQISHNFSWGTLFLDISVIVSIICWLFTCFVFRITIICFDDIFLKMCYSFFTSVFELNWQFVFCCFFKKTKKNKECVADVKFKNGCISQMK